MSNMYEIGMPSRKVGTLQTDGKYQTLNGVRVLKLRKIDEPDVYYSFYAELSNGRIEFYTESGRYISDNVQHPLDLVRTK